MGSTARVRTSTTTAGQTLTTAMSTAIRTFRAISETPTVKASAVAMIKRCLTSRAEADVAETVRAERGKYGSSTLAIAVSTWPGWLARMRMAGDKPHQGNPDALRFAPALTRLIPGQENLFQESMAEKSGGSSFCLDRSVRTGIPLISP
jgi:hypothetical protein